MRSNRSELKLFLIISSIVMILALPACGTDMAKRDVESVIINEENSRFETGNVWLDHGTLKKITGDKLSDILKAEEDMILLEVNQDELPKGTGFELNAVSLQFSLGQRVSAISEDATAVGAGISISCDVTLTCDVTLDASTEKTLESAVENAYDFVKSGVSGVTEAAVFPVSDDMQYATVLFYPRAYIVYGTLTMDDASYQVQITYPCVNAAGCLDGIYSVYEADCLEEIPD